MRKTNLLITLGLLVFGTVMMQAQASRTWVSGVGDDANPCSRTAPCKTFAGAISKTAAGGEIDALDPAGYGALTITKAITIDGGGGQVASVLVSGTNGIVVQAGPSDVVILRNLRFNGIGTGINGIRFLSGKDLNVENCFIFGFTTNGIDIAVNQATAVSAHILNTVVKNVGGIGISATNANASIQVNVVVDHSASILTNKGIQAGDHSRVIVTNSTIASASGLNSAGLSVTASAGDSILTASHNSISYSGTGLTISGNTTAFLADNDFFNNVTTQVSVAAGSTCTSFGTNRFHNPVLGAACPITPQQ